MDQPSICGLRPPTPTPMKLWKPDRRLPGKITSAKLLPSSPFPSPRTKGAKARGRRYEKKAAKEMVRRMQKQEQGARALQILVSPWIEYHDERGRGYACPDLIIIVDAHDSWPAPGPIFLFEIKLTRCQDAYVQLRDLYRPLVRHLWPGRPVIMVQVCKNWAGIGDPIPHFEGLSYEAVHDYFLPL